MSDLTEAQVKILRLLAKGGHIAYSRDGDCGWIAGTSEVLSDRDIWALRDRQYIIRVSDEREDDYDCDKISPAGLAALTPPQRGESS